MSMSRYSSSRAFSGPWKHTSTCLTPKCINGSVKYRNLSTVLGPQWQRPPSAQRQLIRRSSSAVMEMMRKSIAEIEERKKAEAEKLKEVEEEAREPVVKNIGPYIKLEFMHGKAHHGSFGRFWLRDNCQCSKCIHPETRQRMVDTFSIPSDIYAEKTKHTPTTVDIQWSDGHKGVYPNSWLLAHANARYAKKIDLDRPTKFRNFNTWKVSNKRYPTVPFDQVMGDDIFLRQWLDNIYEWGFCFVKGVPVDPEQTKALIERIAFIRNTHYGGFWDFTADLSFKDTAYTTEFLGGHTDNTYFTDPARLQLFHILSHTDGHGGASLLTDGFRAAKILKQENAEHFKLLCTYRQPFHSSGNDDMVIQPVAQYPVLGYHPQLRRLYQIRWNNYDRGAKSNWTAEEQNKWYDAARHFDEITKRPKMQIWRQLEPGTALIFDNWRMLHGRSEFVGKRRMCGGYVNNDDFLSRLRLLKFGRRKVLENIANTNDTPSNPNSYF